jgi:hypothetical protein
MPSFRVVPDGPTLSRSVAHVQPQGSRAAPCSAWLRGAPARLPRRAGRAASAVGEVWPPAGDAGVLRGCAAKAPAQKYRLNFLSAYFQ